MNQPHSTRAESGPDDPNSAVNLEALDSHEPIVAKLLEPETNDGEDVVSPLIVATLVATEEPITAHVVNDLDGAADHGGVTEKHVDPSPTKKRRGFFRRSIGWIGWTVRGCFCISSLIVLLAVLTAIPVLQLIAFGYLLSVAGGLADGAKLRDSLPHLKAAGQIGLAAVAIFIAALPTQALAHLESVSTLINPGSNQAVAMRWAAIGSSLIMTIYLLWAWIRGGKLVHYLWPQPKRWFREGWRWGTWKTAPDRLWNFTTALEMPKYFWLGLRGAVGTLVWLLPAMIIISAFRIGETGLAGLVGFASLVLLGIGMLYVPMLQAHFAAENRLSALFEVRTIRRDFRRAPWAWLLAMVICLVVTPIPLYLLKIEATPREVMWAPCLVFVAFILPARIATGLALRRARRRPEPRGSWSRVSRIFVRLVMPFVVAIYLLFVYVSQYTSWDGLLTWVQQHAILIPVPFLNGV